MKNATFSVIAVLLGASLMVSGCETYSGAGAGGAVIGAGLGAIIGNQSGHAGEGALIGAAVGGLSGLVIHNEKVHRQRDAQQTAQEYNYQPSSGQEMRFEHAEVMPSVVRRGNMAEASIQYALMGVGSGAEVTETRILKKGNEVIAQLSSKTYTRTDGTWVSSGQFKISERMTPGEYTVVQNVQTSVSSISGAANFIVQ